jgi:hypothetical protein
LNFFNVKKAKQINDKLCEGTYRNLMMSPRQRCQKFFLLLESCVGILLEEEG